VPPISSFTGDQLPFNLDPAVLACLGVLQAARRMNVKDKIFFIHVGLRDGSSREFNLHLSSLHLKLLINSLSFHEESRSQMEAQRVSAISAPSASPRETPLRILNFKTHGQLIFSFPLVGAS
jgi:hypothetical protein